MSVALVTGASRGIGRTIALELANKGYDLALCYSGNHEAAQDTLEACKKFGGQVIAVKADVSQAKDVTDLFSQIKDQLGPVEILVNNAGITRDGLMLGMKEADFDRVLEVNLKGAFLCSKAALRDMLKAKKGRIISISSVVGLNGNSGQANYAASKAGLIGLTKSMAKEYGPKGIRANAVAPGFIETAMTAALSEETRQEYLNAIAARHFGKSEDVAHLVAFLASDEAEYINGQVISVDGGM